MVVALWIMLYFVYLVRVYLASVTVGGLYLVLVFYLQFISIISEKFDILFALRSNVI